MLQLSQGNEYSLTYTIQNEDGSSKDLTGSLELKYELSNKKQTAPLIQFTLADAELTFANDTVTVKLSNTLLNTLKEGSHYHEIWQTNAIGQATTLMAEKITISSKLIKE